MIFVDSETTFEKKLNLPIAEKILTWEEFAQIVMKGEDDDKEN